MFTFPPKEHNMREIQFMLQRSAPLFFYLFPRFSPDSNLIPPLCPLFLTLELVPSLLTCSLASLFHSSLVTFYLLLPHLFFLRHHCSFLHPSTHRTLKGNMPYGQRIYNATRKSIGLVLFPHGAVLGLCRTGSTVRCAERTNTKVSVLQGELRKRRMQEEGEGISHRVCI